MVSSAETPQPDVETASVESPEVGKKRHVPPPLRTKDAKEIEGRFWPKVKRGGPDECWPWQSSITRGYGMITAWGRPQYAHRIAYALQNGDVPLGGYVLHKCDNPPCCNGAHLFLGDQRLNMVDRAVKGRVNSPKGEACHFLKLTSEQALAIYNARGMFKDIAAQYGVSITAVGQIKMGTRWKHVTGGQPAPRYYKRNVA